MWGGLGAVGATVGRTVQIAKNGVVIGESMGRVNKAAKSIGAATYKAPGKGLIKAFGGKNATKTMMNQNKAWMNRIMKYGVKITDIGINVSRPLSIGRSPFYAMEKATVSGYGNLTSMLWH